jgi:molybdate transport system ATP-binding protein
MLELKIHKRFANFQLEIDAVTLSAGVTVLFGPSGAGKTLTLDCIAGFATPDEGRILIDDKIVFDHQARLNLPPQQRRCGYVLQNYALFPHMTLWENLLFAAPQSPNAVQQMLERFRIASGARHYPHQLSGGQKQRGSIARALLASPRILLLDEPSRGLDAELRAEFYALLRQVRQQFQTPMLLVSHSLDECFELADQMLVMGGGRVVQKGAPAEILARPASADIARLFGCFNVFEAEITSMSETRNWSRLQVGEESLEAGFLPGRNYGDRVCIAVRTNALRAWPRERRTPLGFNQIAAVFERAIPTPAGCRLEFAGDLRIDSDLRDPSTPKEWVVEFPPESLLVIE